ncbi:MAG: YeeE/YedE family protein [Alphaproteobacteria bacterium]
MSDASVTVTTPERAPGRLAPLSGGQPIVLGVGLLLLAAGAGFLAAEVGGRQASLFVIGGLLGLVLYHASFGFTSAWRRFITDRRGSGLRAQMVMLAIAVALFFPMLQSGSIFGQPVSGFVMPAGTSVLVGAFIFGIGMQLGGGCGSGTLFTVGGGGARMMITLAFFILGSLIATHHVGWWHRLPAFAPTSIRSELGLWAGMLLSLALFACIALASWWLERRRHGAAPLFGPAAPSGHSLLQRMLRGPWPILWGAVGLALLNALTLAVKGAPWGITSAFALWGAKIAMAVGWDVSSWQYWVGQGRALAAPVYADTTSVMDFGILLGAFFAAGLAGKFAPIWSIPARSMLAAVLGGILLGYGARLSFGCNIGAFFSGIASGSLHGWFWIAAAFVGNVAGTRLRPVFRI